MGVDGIDKADIFDEYFDDEKPKYIIKNCPNYDDYFNPNETCRKRYSQYCQDCTDCILKQIVELCKEESSIIQHKQKVKVKGLNKLADRILELLDIQEVE